MSEKYWITLMKSENKFYVLCSEKGELTVRNSQKEMLKELTAKYALHNGQSLGVKVSTFLHNNFFQPSVIGMTLEEMSEKLFDLQKGTNVYKLSAQFGNFLGLYCNSEKNIETIFIDGAKPKLGLG
jgi:hypothetical protein